MKLVYKIIGLSVILALLYFFYEIYENFIRNKKGSIEVKFFFNIFLNMLKIIITFSLVCIGIIFLLLRPAIYLIS